MQSENPMEYNVEEDKEIARKREEEIMKVSSNYRIEPNNKEFENSLGETLMKEGMYAGLMQNLASPMILNPAMEETNEFVSLLSNSESSQLKQLLIS